MAAFREIHKLRGQATRDYESLRGYIDTYRTRADNLEGQVGKWCDELEQLTTQHDKTVNTYLRRYHRLEGATNGLLTRVRALEVRDATKHAATGGYSKTCCCQDESLAKRLSKMEGRMQALEDKCKTKDDKIKSLSAKCDAFYKRAARHERDIQDALSSATTTKAQSKVANPTTTGEEDACLTSLVQTVELHGHYFEEIRDHILQQEDTSKKAPTSAESLSQIKDLQKRIVGAVAQAHKRTVDKNLEKIKRQLEQWTKEVNVLSQQCLQNKERFTLLEEAGESLDLKLCESKRRTDAVLADFKSSVDGQVAAHKKAVDAETKKLGVSFHEKLADFANELQKDRLDGMRAQIQQLQSHYEELEARLHEQAMTEPDTTIAAEPVRPTTSVFQFAAFPPLQSGMGAGTMNVRNVGEEDHSMGGAFGHTQSASGDQPMADVSLFSHHTSGVQDEVSGRCDFVTGNTTAEQYQAGRHEPGLAAGVPSGHTRDGLYGAVDAEDEPMDLSSGSSCDDFVVKSAAPDRGLVSQAAAVVAAPGVGNRNGDDNRVPAGDSRHTTGQSQDDKLVASQPGHGTTGGGIQIPGLGALPKTEIPQICTPSPLAEDELRFDPKILSGVGGQPSTDFVLYNRAPAPTPSPAHTTLSQLESKTEVRSPFSGILVRVPPTPTVEPKALSEPKPLKQAVQPLQPGDIAGSQSKTAAARTTPPPLAGPVRRQLPLPQRHPEKPAISSPVTRNVPRASAPSPPLEALSFNYSADYVDKLRIHVIYEALESWLEKRINREYDEKIEETIRKKAGSLDSVGTLAEQDGLASQDAYSRAAVEQIFSTWFDNCIVPEVDGLGVVLVAGSFEKEDEMGRFMEEIVRDYMEKHPADHC